MKLNSINFFGFTKSDGSRGEEASKDWPFGTVGPVTEYSFRYAPDSAVYEKQPRERKVTTKIGEAEPGNIIEALSLPPGAFAFGALVATLVTFGDKS
jgi:hypothetical protein